MGKGICALLHRKTMQKQQNSTSINTKKAVILKLLPVRLKATLRKLHNTLFAP